MQEIRVFVAKSSFNAADLQEQINEKISKWLEELGPEFKIVDILQDLRSAGDEFVLAITVICDVKQL